MWIIIITLRQVVSLWQQSSLIALALPEPSPPEQLSECEGRREDDTDEYIDKDTDKDLVKEKEKKDRDKDIEITLLKPSPRGEREWHLGVRGREQEWIIPFPKFGNGKGIEKTHSLNSGMGREWKKTIPKIQEWEGNEQSIPKTKEREGNEKNPFTQFGNRN